MIFKFRNHAKVLLSILLIAALIISTAIYFYYQHLTAQHIVKISTSAHFPKDFPWDLELLSRPPKVKWLNKTGKIKSCYYEGLPYKGKKTDVFAYYATPGSISGGVSKDQNLPGIVIVHGGCQAASKSVVNLWAQRGYAAISMDLELLSRPPKVKWLNKSGKIKSFYYEGLPYKGKKTDVFAYYATPGSISGDVSKDRNLPGIVIVHGGCQAASKSVVNLWAQRGYAAISMDLDGHGPDLRRIKNGGPPAEAYMSYDWNYHAVAKIILAHSLLLSFKEIDNNRTAITGLSVGGHLTCIVAGIDDRFKAAASVYGTGFIYEKGFFKNWYEKRLTSKQQRLWRDLIDPSNYFGNITCPFLFAGNPNDKFYPLETRIKSYDLLKVPFYFYLDPDLPHSNVGHTLYILQSFFNQYLNAGTALPVLQKPERKGDKLYVRSSDVQKKHSAYVCFTTDVEPSDRRKWQTYPAQINKDGIIADLPPEGTIACFVNYFVDEHVMVSSKVLILDNSFLR